MVLVEVVELIIDINRPIHALWHLILFNERRLFIHTKLLRIKVVAWCPTEIIMCCSEDRIWCWENIPSGFCCKVYPQSFVYSQPYRLSRLLVCRQCHTDQQFQQPNEVRKNNIQAQWDENNENAQVFSKLQAYIAGSKQRHKSNWDEDNANKHECWNNLQMKRREFIGPRSLLKSWRISMYSKKWDKILTHLGVRIGLQAGSSCWVNLESNRKIENGNFLSSK